MNYRPQTPEVDFKNFMPTEHVAAGMSATLSWLTDVLPSDAEVNATLRKVGTQYLCKLDVVSSVGCFRGESFDSSPQDAVDNAVEDVKMAAKSWQKVHLGLDGVSFIELMTH